MRLNIYLLILLDPSLSLLILDLTTVDNLNLASRTTSWRSILFQKIQHFVALRDLTKDSVVTIQPRGLVKSDEELGAIGVLQVIRWSLLLSPAYIFYPILTGPALAMERTPLPVCFKVKFSLNKK